MGKGSKFWCLVLVIGILLSLFTACEEETPTKKRRRSNDDEKEEIVTEFTLDDLLGSWTVKTEDYEATLVFEEEDEVYSATWTVFDYAKEVWNEETFQIKERSGFTLLSLMADGQIEYFTIAPFGQTLYFEGLYYTNSDKNVGLPADVEKYAFIREGQQTKVMHNVFLGMTYDEVKRSYPDVEELEERSYGTYPYSAAAYNADVDVPNHSGSYAIFSFDENKQLASASLRLIRSKYDATSYHTLKPAAEAWLAEATEIYGEYTMTERTYTDYNEENHIYHTYRWDLGNVVCEITFDYLDTTDNLDGVTKSYKLKEYA
jgi:hypothetical protein